MNRQVYSFGIPFLILCHYASFLLILPQTVVLFIVKTLDLTNFYLIPLFISPKFLTFALTLYNMNA